MRILRETYATIVLTLALTISVFAGQISSPGVVPPPPPPSETSTSVSTNISTLILTIISMVRIP